MPNLRALPLVLCLACGLYGNEFDQVKYSLGKLRKNDPKVAEDLKSQSIPVRLIMERVDPINTSWMVKLMCAEWMLRAHLFLARSASGPQPDLAYLNRAWDLASVASEQSRAIKGYKSTQLPYGVPNPAANGLPLPNHFPTTAISSAQFEEVPSEVQAALTWLCAEIPVRLGDPAKMERGLETFRVKPNKDSRAMVYAMISAFHTGDWVLAASLGKALEASPKVLQAFHEQSLGDPKAFDYTALLQLLTEAKPEVFTGTLSVQKVQVKQYRFRCTQVEGSDTAAVAKAKTEYKTSWETPPLQGATIQVTGAVAHWPMSFGNQLPLSGFLTTERLTLQGYADSPTGRFTDTLSLQPDPARKNFWVGTMISHTPPAPGLTCRFEVEAELE